MSGISSIFGSYKHALDDSRTRFESLYAERAENGRIFYEQFFHQLIVPYGSRFASDAQRTLVRRQIERFFGSSDINFVAIDGTCDKDTFSDFMVFYGGAYGARGRVSVDGDPPRTRYEKWELNRDVSMVAWIPVPFAQLSDVASQEETFMVSDADRVNLSSIHNMLMQLAEVYLAYNVATGSSIDAPQLIMLDQSMSSLMAAASHGANTGLVGYPYDRRHLDAADVAIAFAHPFNAEMGIPSTKRFGRHNAIIAHFDREHATKLPLSRLRDGLQLTENELHYAVDYLCSERRGLRLCTIGGTQLSISIDPRHSWAYTVSLFENICGRLFLKKDQAALTYEVPDADNPTITRRRWMSPDDVSFLLAVGLRRLVEVCWDKRILLVGVVKDSGSRYLTRNYLGVLKHLGIYPLDDLNVGLLPWTDRIYMESIPMVCDEKLEAPWSSIEFDSTFMTLSLKADQRGKPEIMGVRVQGGEIVATERLFVRSLAQFFLSRRKPTPLMGHCVFLDRLCFPGWDKDAFGEVQIGSTSLGRIAPVVYKTNEAANVGQTVAMYLLKTLTRNHFPEVIGYPDPLHKADWGAKSIGRRVKRMTASSEIPFRANPIAKTFRAIRDARAR